MNDGGESKGRRRYVIIQIKNIKTYVQIAEAKKAAEKAKAEEAQAAKDAAKAKVRFFDIVVRLGNIISLYSNDRRMRKKQMLKKKRVKKQKQKLISKKPMKKVCFTDI